MIVVTGGAGFIGSNLVAGLNALGRDDVVVVDDLSDGGKFFNLVNCRIADYLDLESFRARIAAHDPALPRMEAIFHQGACTDTTERDGRYMLDINYACSMELLEHCRRTDTRLIYASSAAVYGTGAEFAELPGHERPVNVYGYSKKLFDDAVRRALPAATAQLAGLRYFNVYGPGEWHKGGMASMALHLHRQLRGGGTGRLFRGSGGYGDGEQRRDFVHVDDVVKVNLWLLENPQVSGIFNVGTGVSRSFNDLAAVLISACGGGSVEYMDMPEQIRIGYQSYTQAELGALRAAGFAGAFTDLETGVRAYAAVLDRAGEAR
ncbi:MAG: ADP-glyceromanno-heptose 6-epimerase [Gammaproteobacteria bacterium]|nr:ADP-glyceromanno-heptose 6-epimerase [Gammaproteobacteria bacterium]